MHVQGIVLTHLFLNTLTSKQLTYSLAFTYSENDKVIVCLGERAITWVNILIDFFKVAIIVHKRRSVPSFTEKTPNKPKTYTPHTPSFILLMNVTLKLFMGTVCWKFSRCRLGAIGLLWPTDWADCSHSGMKWLGKCSKIRKFNALNVNYCS